MAVTTTNLGVITAYGDAVAAGYTGTKAEWQALMASYATVGQQAVDAKNDAVAAKNTAVSKATEATTAASTATTKANEASASAQSIAQSAAQIQENTDDIEQLKSELTTFNEATSLNFADGAVWSQGAWIKGNNWSDGALNGNTTRIGTTIDLGFDNITDVQLYVTDSNYSLEFYAFNNQHESVGYNTSWQTTYNLKFTKGVRYIRIDMRKNDNSTVTNAISKYFVANVKGACNAKTALILGAKSNNLKLNLVSHNVGGYNYGNSGEYGGDDVSDKIMEWKRMINHYGADIFLVQENHAYFDSAHNIPAASTLFEPIYPFYVSEGNQGTYIASKFILTNPETYTLTGTIGSTSYTRWARKAEINIDGITIAVVNVHLSPSSGSEFDNVRAAQFTDLAEHLVDYKYVIIGGDFNTSAASFMELIKSKGYTPVNNEYVGAIDTLLNDSPDNILLKGFIPCHTEASSTYACTSDHYPLNAIVRFNDGI